MRLQVIRDDPRVFAMRLHPQGQCFKTAHCKEAVERALDRPGGIQQEPEFFSQFRIIANDGHATHHIGMTVQVLGSAVKGEVEADLGPIEVVVANPHDGIPEGTFGVLLQYPGTTGALRDHTALIATAHEAGALVAVTADLLAMTLLIPPGEMGADVVVGSSQRFGVPMMFGGPHAGYMAVRDADKRNLPGRLVGVSKDSADRPALRLCENCGCCMLLAKAGGMHVGLH